MRLLWNYRDYIELGLNGEEPLKLILCGSVESKDNNNVEVVSVVYATTDKNLAEQKMQELLGDKNNSDKYYMVYSVPLDTDLTTLKHYPSIEFRVNDDLIMYLNNGGEPSLEKGSGSPSFILKRRLMISPVDIRICI